MKKRNMVLKTLTLSGIALVAFTSLPMIASAGDNIPTLEANVGYVQVSKLPAIAATINPIRLQAIRETATELGARGGLAWRSVQINQSLKNQAEYLDHVFDFNQLLLAHNVLPPVLTEADNSLNLASDTSIRLASKIYKIQANARFVTAPPTWRSYLTMNYDRPQMPDQSLLPRTQAEAKAWDLYLKKGWKQGLIQANDIFRVNLSRLKRDYNGIILYRKLLAEHMVSSPFVAHANMGVTGDGNELRINDRQLRITALSQLQPNSNKWTPVLIH